MNANEISKIRKTVWDLIGFEFGGRVAVEDSADVLAAYDGKNARVGGADRAMLARAFFLLAQNIRAGKTKFEIRQQRHFESCGVMLDMSRNGVMTVDGVKRFVANMAALGMNYIMLYTEDTYEVKEYPLFGYMRGRYTAKELREIDDYADSLGVEVVPCIQTLAHLKQFLHWYDVFMKMGDTREILMAGKPEVYDFIEAAIRTLSGIFRSHRIHIGMDEAHMVGLGRYLDVNGYQNRFEILSKHCEKVCDICRKYNYEPMMWSDMYFRLVAGGQYYATEAEFPPELLKMIPDVGMMYWDYYHTNEDHYDKMLEQHKKMGKKVLFAGGIQTWYGGLPRYQMTEDTSFAALRSCLRHNISMAVATMWGDDGAETNAFMALPQLPIYSEFCYLGEGCTMEDVKAASRCLTGVDYDRMADIGHATFNINSTDILIKPLLFADVMYDLGSCTVARAPKTEQEARALATACARDQKLGRYTDFFRYAELYYRIVAEKANLRANLRKAYKKKDTDYLRHAAEKRIPAIRRNTKKLAALHEKVWLHDYKPFGLEVIEYRYGGVIARLDYAEKTLKAFVAGETDSIPELEAEYCEQAQTTDFVHGSVTPSVIY